jgi:hypothetical protein
MIVIPAGEILQVLFFEAGIPRKKSFPPWRKEAL